MVGSIAFAAGLRGLRVIGRSPINEEATQAITAITWQVAPSFIPGLLIAPFVAAAGAIAYFMTRPAPLIEAPHE